MGGNTLAQIINNRKQLTIGNIIMFDPNKQYRTQNGKPYRHLRIDGEFNYPVKGEVLSDAGDWIQISHTRELRWLSSLNNFKLNLVEVTQ
jgi:hypothetical protein